MPELPEVETICNALRLGAPDRPAVTGLAFSHAQVLWNRSVAAPGVEEFCRRLPGQVIQDIGRRGKFLIFSLTDDSLLVHLRMSGDLLVEPQEAPLAPHHRVVLDLENGWRLAFNDARKFGRLWLVRDPGLVTGSLGPEPLDESFTSQDFYQRLRNRNRQLKPLLLDQTFLAGLGNIYADEALHEARLHPLAIARSLTVEQAERLWLAVRLVLQEGIRHNGASLDWVYRGGDFQNYFHVYQRAGQPCLRCRTPIQRIVVGQRGTHFCPECQKL
jgi:formamidopyrimidine-DNA glycosylase